MNRRSFMALASGLLVPWQPERVYSFLPAWRLMNRASVEHLLFYAKTLSFHPDVRLDHYTIADTKYRAPLPKTGEAFINPANALDILKSADAYGLPRPVIL